jgi:hypothetical protein
MRLELTPRADRYSSVFGLDQEPAAIMFCDCLSDERPSSPALQPHHAIRAAGQSSNDGIF